jgi:hypothetical protein
MRCRIKADTSEPPRGVVAKKIRDEAMRGLMKRYGDDHRYRPDRRQIYCVTAHSFGFEIAPKISLFQEQVDRVNVARRKSVAQFPPLAAPVSRLDWTRRAAFFA